MDRAFRDALLAVPPTARDAWVDRALGIGVIPDDGPDLPRGCVPYLPCAVDALLALVDRAEITATDVFVDVGCGVGRALAIVQRLTGAAAIGVEIQAALVEIARARSPRLEIVHGDASVRVPDGSVYLLYAPFSGERLDRLLAQLERIARTRPIRVGCVDVTLPACAWLDGGTEGDGVTVYRSR